MCSAPREVGKPGHLPPGSFSTLDRGLRQLSGREPWVGPSRGGRRGGMGGGGIASPFWAEAQTSMCPVHSPSTGPIPAPLRPCPLEGLVLLGLSLSGTAHFQRFPAPRRSCPLGSSSPAPKSLLT